MCQISVTCEYGDHFVSNCGGHPVSVNDMFQVTKSQLEKSIFLIWPNTGRGEIKTHQASSSHERPYFLCKHNLTAGTREGSIVVLLVVTSHHKSTLPRVFSLPEHNSFVKR